MMQSIFDKTERGREEIATRKFHLPPRMRTLLLLFDGKHTTEEVLSKVGGIGLNEQHVAQLAASGFIHSDTYLPPGKTAPKPSAPVAPSIEPISAASYDTEAHLQALYKFYSDTIRSEIGLRGYALQLKVERARSVDDFRMIRPDYLGAVKKAQSEEVAQELDAQLLHLLNNPPRA